MKGGGRGEADKEIRGNRKKGGNKTKITGN
jgi:hypothetical protein